MRALIVLLALLGVGRSADLDGYGSTVYPWVMIVLVLIVIGMLAVFIVEFIIVYKVVRLGGVPWRSIWLGQTLLFGILLSYLTLIAFIFKPTVVSCDIVRFGAGFSYALMLVVLFVKVLIVLSPKTQAGFLKLGHQILILVILWAIQIAINAEWLILMPSETQSKEIEKVIDNGESTRLDTFEGTVCKATRLSSLFFDILASFSYIMLLRLIVLILALVSYKRSEKQEGKPSSESKWILVTTVVTTIIWLVWILVGSFVDDAGIASIAIGLWCTATAKLVIMFIPKLHKLATLKQGEFYYEDDIPGLASYNLNNEDIELDADPDHHSVLGPPSYQAESVLYAPSEPDAGPRLHATDRAPRYQSPFPGRSPSLILKKDTTDKVHYNPDPNALELQHPTSRSAYPVEQYSSLSQVGETSSYGPPTQRYYTIGGHGRRGSASVIGVPRYEKRYVPVTAVPQYTLASEPRYVHELANVRPPRQFSDSSSASVVSMPRYDPHSSQYRRQANGYANPAFLVESHEPLHYRRVPVHKAASVVGIPRYEPRVVMAHQPESKLSNTRRTASYQDLRGATVVQVNPQPNGHTMTGSLPRPAKLLYRQGPNGKLVPVEQRSRAFSDDVLERRSVY